MENFPFLNIIDDAYQRDATSFNSQVSYKGAGTKLDGRSDGILFSGAPVLGFYRKRFKNDWYLFFSRLLLVQFDPIVYWNFLPSSVQNVLKNVNRCFIRGAIVIDVKIKSEDEDTVARKSRLVNLLYHSWVGEIMGKKGNFEIDIPMGIFEPNGIEPYTQEKFDVPDKYGKRRVDKRIGISFGELGKQRVHEHGAYSPDNARFVVSSNRNIATFWSVAVYPGHAHALVTFHILVNNDDIAVLMGADAQTTLNGLLHKYYTDVLPKISGQEDKNVLH